MNEAEHVAALKATTSRYIKIDDARRSARDEAIAAVLDALRDGVPPTTVTELSPFTATYVRQLARTAGIPAAQTRRPPKRRRTPGKSS